VYKQYIDYLGKDVQSIDSYKEIPFLPIEFFKNKKVYCGAEKHEDIFLSSGTTGSVQSNHFVKDLSVYEESFIRGFEYFYGDIKEYCVLALLPSYLERDGSSLVYMVNDLIEQSNHKDSGFYLHNINELVEKLKKLSSKNQKVLLIGVTYALLDIAENFSLELPNTIVMETGGMKGRRKEMIREELHDLLTKQLGVKSIHSEYGMTELLSQGYSHGDGVFNCPPWMKILIRDVNDPLSLLSDQSTGGINVIDLANINSCSFIATQDLGKLYPDGSFEVLGRFDTSDIRGCNLMVE